MPKLQTLPSRIGADEVAAADSRGRSAPPGLLRRQPWPARKAHRRRRPRYRWICRPGSPDAPTILPYASRLASPSMIIEAPKASCACSTTPLFSYRAWTVKPNAFDEPVDHLRGVAVAEGRVDAAARWFLLRHGISFGSWLPRFRRPARRRIEEMLPGPGRSARPRQARGTRAPDAPGRHSRSRRRCRPSRRRALARRDARGSAGRCATPISARARSRRQSAAPGVFGSSRSLARSRLLSRGRRSRRSLRTPRRFRARAHPPRRACRITKASAMSKRVPSPPRCRALRATSSPRRRARRPARPCGRSVPSSACGRTALRPAA